MPAGRATLLLVSLILAGAAAPTTGSAGDDGGGAVDRGAPTLAEAHPAEQLALQRLLESGSWTKRSIAAVRLQRFGCPESRDRLVDLVGDDSWRVRAFALLSLAHRGETLEAAWLQEETEPRVVRCALRCGMRMQRERLERGVRDLSESGSLDDRLLAAEIAAASGDEALVELALDIVRRVILTMDRVEAGVLAPRLALLTGSARMHRPRRWQRWLREQGRGLTLRTGPLLDVPRQPAPIAGLEPEPFAGMMDYMQRLSERRVDLALCLDCTASMSGELTAAQGGIDDLMLFVGDVVRELRVGLVVYRDRRDRDFETKGWDFTADPDLVRRRLWTLGADGGGDSREMVFEALELAYTKLSWDSEHTRVLVLIGDAPPHVGYGGRCVEMARLAAAGGCVTNVIQTEDRDVQHFPDIAEAGTGRCVSLEDDERLAGEIAGLTIGDRYREELADFFETFLVLCR